MSSPEPNNPILGWRVSTANADNWAARLFAFIGIAGIIAAVYTPLYFNETVLLGRADLWGQFAPWAFYFDHALSNGVWPQWNPLVLCGVPFSANPQSAVFYPPHLIRALLNFSPTPLSTFQSLWIMQSLHLIILGVGMHCICRKLGVSYFSSLLAACAVALSAIMVYRSVQHWTFIAFAAHFPWQLLMLHALLTAQTLRAKLTWTLLFAALTAQSILLGAPQLLLYSVSYLAVYAFSKRLVEFFGKDTALSVRKTLRTDFMMAAIAIVVALGLSAVLLLPALEFVLHCTRGNVDTDPVSGILIQQNHSMLGVLRALLDYRGENSLRFFGLLGMLMVLCAFFDKRLMRAVPILLPGMLMLDFIIGPPMPFASMAKYFLPGLISEPERATILGIVFMGILLGMGMDIVHSKAAAHLNPASRAVILLFIGLLASYFLYRDLRDTQDTHLWMWLLPALGAITIALAQFQRASKYLGVLSELILLLHIALSAQHYAHQLAFANPFPSDRTMLRNAAQWKPQNERAIADKWLENTGIFQLNPVINGYDPLIPSEMELLLRPHNTNRSYDRRISAEDVGTNNTIAQNLLHKRFHLVHGYSTDASSQNFISMKIDGSTLEVLDLSYNSVTVKAFIPNEPALLLFSEYNYPGWKASLNDSEVPILRAYTALQAVEVPAGNHIVRFVFNSPSLHKGFIITIAFAAATAFALAFLILKCVVEKRRIPMDNPT